MIAHFPHLSKLGGKLLEIAGAADMALAISSASLFAFGARCAAAETAPAAAKAVAINTIAARRIGNLPLHMSGSPPESRYGVILLVWSKSGRPKFPAFSHPAPALRRAFASNECLKNNRSFEFGGNRE